MNQGWHECKNNEMHFYPCGFNIPRIANQLSNCIDVITGQRNRIKLNPMTESYVHNDDLKDCEIEEKRHNKEDANNNKNKEQDW